MCPGTGLVSNLRLSLGVETHPVPPPLPGAHTHSVHHTHTTTLDTQYHAIHAPTPDVQRIHLQQVCNTMHPSIPDV